MNTMTHDIVERARLFAQERHAGLFRKNKGQQPAYGHLAEVAGYAAKAGASPAAVAAAWLHDVVEDTPTRLEEIQAVFGDEVALLVDALTDPADFAGRPLVERKALQAERLKQKSGEVFLVKLSDQLSNVLSVYNDAPVDWEAQKSLEYIRGAKKVADVCKGQSAFLDQEFAAAFALAEAKFNQN